MTYNTKKTQAKKTNLQSSITFRNESSVNINWIRLKYQQMAMLMMQEKKMKYQQTANAREHNEREAIHEKKMKKTKDKKKMQE